MRASEPGLAVRPAPMLGTILLALLLLASTAACAGEITVAAAADLTFALQEVAAGFAQQHRGDSIKLSFGSSGNFFSQILNGAPYDVFFSADADYPRKLEAASRVEPGTFYEYARGKIVVWVPRESKLDLRGGLAVLADTRVRKIAIANPQHAPYGRAALAALKHDELYERVKDRLVLGENIAQTAQFVQSGNADVAILALSLAKAPAMKESGRYVEIPAADYPPIVQAAVILRSARDKKLARRFLDYLKRPETRATMRRHGFGAPPEEAASPN